MNTTDSSKATRDGEAVVRQLRAVRSDTRELASTVSELVADAETAAREQLQQRPYTALAMAMGIGYVLGGGLPFRLTALLFAFGTRVAFEMATRELTARLAAQPSEHSGSRQ